MHVDVMLCAQYVDVTGLLLQMRVMVGISTENAIAMPCLVLRDAELPAVVGAWK